MKTWRGKEFVGRATDSARGALPKATPWTAAPWRAASRRAAASASRLQSTVVIAAVATLAMTVLFLSVPAQTVYAGLSFSIDAKIDIDTRHSAETESDAQVLTIAAGEDTVNLGEKAVPLGEMREPPEERGHGAEVDKAKKPGDIVDIRIDKRKPRDINITIGDEVYGNGKDIVRFGENIEVAEGDTIEGDVVAIGGTITVDGVVSGDCVSIGGSINMGPTGVIEGDGVSVGGCINKEPGSVLEGDEVCTGGNIPQWLFHGGWPMHGMTGIKFAGLVVSVGKALIVLFLAWLIVLISRDRVVVTCDKAKSSMLASFGVGLLIMILAPIAMVLLCITLIGIPVAILLPFALLVAGLFGYTAVGLALGQKLSRDGARAEGVVKATLLGVLLIEAIPIVGKAIGLPGGILWGLSIPVRIVGYAIMVCALLIGLGATVLSKFGQAPRAPVQGAIAPPAPGAPAGTPGPVPQASGVPGYGAPTGGTPVTPA